MVWRLGRIAFAAMFIASPAVADMGLAPAGPGQVYGSAEGGFLYQDGGDVNAYGISSAPGTYVDQFVSADGGWLAGLQLGYENGKPFISFLPFTRVELFVFGGRTDGGRSDSAPPLSDISLKSVDGLVNVIGGTVANAETERQTVEFGYRSEFDQRLNADTTITWGYVSFIRNSQEDTLVTCTSLCSVTRSAGLDNWLFGSMLVMEPEFRIVPSVALVGRLGAGFYLWEAEADFLSSAPSAPGSPFNAAVRDKEDGIGFRGSLGASLKIILSPGAFFETFAEADYFSDMATARFSNASTTDTTPSFIVEDSMWEFRTGGRLTVQLSQ